MPLRSVGATALRLLPLTALARGAGLVVPMLLARWHGADGRTDAFWFTMGAGAFLVTLGGLVVGTVLVPVFAELRRHHPERVAPVLGAAVRQAVVLGLAVGLGARLVLPEVAARGAPGGPLPAEVARLALALVPYLATLGPTAVLRAALEAEGGLAHAALSPLGRVAATLAVALALHPEGPAGLPLAWLAGGIVEAAWLGLGLRRFGVGLAPALDAPELRAAAWTALPVLVGEGLVAGNGWVARGLAALAGPGTTTLLEYADRARLVPQALLEGTLLVAAYTAWSQARAAGEVAGRRAQVAQSLGWVALGAAPLLGATWTARVVLARLLYGGGALDATAVGTLADTLGAWLPAVYASLLGAVVARALVVEGRAAVLLPLGVLSFAAHTALGVALVSRGAPGLALASSIATGATALAGLAVLAPQLRGALPRGAVLETAGVVAASVAGALLLPVPATWSDPAILALAAWVLPVAWVTRRLRSPA